LAVAVKPRGAMWDAGTPTKIVDGRAYTGGGLQHYDVSPDGERFLMIKDGAGTGQRSRMSRLSLC